MDAKLRTLMGICLIAIATTGCTRPVRVRALPAPEPEQPAANLPVRIASAKLDWSAEPGKLCACVTGQSSALAQRVRTG